MPQKDIKMGFGFARKYKCLLNDFWTFGFYLDGVSFAHKSKLYDQAKCRRSMVL